MSVRSPKANDGKMNTKSSSKDTTVIDSKEKVRTSPKIMIRPPVVWTRLDEEAYIKENIAQKRYMTELAAQGPSVAEKRVHDARRKLWWEQQSPEMQTRHIRRKKMREKSRMNKIERRQLIHTAMFMFWTPAVQHEWVRGAVMDLLAYMHTTLETQRNKRLKIDAHQMDYLRILTNAYMPTEESIFKRIKRKLDLTSFYDAREIRDKDIDRAKQRPSSHPSEFLASGRAQRAASRGSTSGSRGRSSSGDRDNRPASREWTPPAEKTVSAAAQVLLTNGSKAHRHNGSTNVSDAAANKQTSGIMLRLQFGQPPMEAEKFRPAALILKEMKDSYEKECFRAYRYFAENITRVFSTYKNTNKYVVREIHSAEIEAQKTIDGSTFLSILPPHQKKLKTMSLKAEAMARDYHFLKHCCHSFAKSIDVIDRGWARQMATMLSLSVLERYDAEAQKREQGRQLAAAKIQSLFRMNSMRIVYRNVMDVVAIEVSKKSAKSKKLAAERAMLEKAEEDAKNLIVEEAKANELEGDVCAIFNVSSTNQMKHIRFNEAPIYEFDVNIFFSNAGMRFKSQNNVSVYCLQLRSPQRTELSSSNEEDNNGPVHGYARGPGVRRGLLAASSLGGNKSHAPVLSSASRCKYRCGSLLLLFLPTENLQRTLELMNVPSLLENYSGKVVNLPVTTEWRGKLANISNKLEDSIEPDELVENKPVDEGHFKFSMAARKVCCHVTVHGLLNDQEYQLITFVDAVLLARGSQQRIPNFGFHPGGSNEDDQKAREKMRYVLAPCQSFIINKHRPFSEDTGVLGHSQLTGNDFRDAVGGFVAINNPKTSSGTTHGARRRNERRGSRMQDSNSMENDMKAMKLFVDQSVRMGEGKKEQTFITLKTPPAPPSTPRIVLPLEAIFRASEPLVDGRITLLLQWRPGHSGGLPIDDFEIYRRIVVSGTSATGGWRLLAKTMEVHLPDTVSVSTLQKVAADYASEIDSGIDENHVGSQDEVDVHSESSSDTSELSEACETQTSSTERIVFVSCATPLGVSLVIQYRIRCKTKAGYSPFSVGSVLVKDKRDLDGGRAMMAATMTKELAIRALEAKIAQQRNECRPLSAGTRGDPIRSLSIDLAEMFCSPPEHDSADILLGELGYTADELDDLLEDDGVNEEQKALDMNTEQAKETVEDDFASLLHQLSFVSPLSDVNVHKDGVKSISASISSPSP